MTVTITQANTEQNLPITLTSAAIAHIQKWIEKRGGGIGLRVSIKATGCSGYAYVADIAETQEADDYVSFQADGTKVFVDPKSYPFVKGLTIDYVREGIGHKFKYINPNEKGSCGCGESFTV